MSDVIIPGEVAVAINSGRPELLRLGVKREPLTDGLYQAIGFLIQQINTLRLENAKQAKTIEGLITKARDLVSDTNSVSRTARAILFTLERASVGDEDETEDAE